MAPWPPLALWHSWLSWSFWRSDLPVFLPSALLAFGPSGPLGKGGVRGGAPESENLAMSFALLFDPFLTFHLDLWWLLAFVYTFVALVYVLVCEKGGGRGGAPAPGGREFYDVCSHLARVFICSLPFFVALSSLDLCRCLASALMMVFLVFLWPSVSLGLWSLGFFFSDDWKSYGDGSSCRPT